jgi:rhodanese-related sulfurtransferase
MNIRRAFIGLILISLILTACSTANAQPKIVMGAPTGESSCAKETPGTVMPCKLHISATGTQQPGGVIGLRSTPTAEKELGYSKISPTDLNAALNNKDFLLVNVHVPFIGNLPQTDLSIPYDQIDQNLSKLPADKNAKIVLYCSSGHMSGIAAADLVKQGYTNVWSLTGGMSAWQQAGFTIDR